MRYPKTIRPVSVLFLLTLLIGCGGLIASSAPAPATSNRGGGSPFRLRLHANPSTLASGEGTSVWAEFLDRDYKPVPSDGERVIRFAAPRGSGSFTEPAVTVKGGEWPGGTWFKPATLGKVVITASSEPLESDQTVLIVTQRRASWFSQLFETVAYANPPGSFEFDPKSASKSAGEKTWIKFELSWQPAPEQDTDITISTNSSGAKIMYNGKVFSGAVPVKFLKGSSKSIEPIYINSTTEETVSVAAKSSDGTELAAAEVRFTKPSPYKLVIDDEQLDIMPGQDQIPFTIKLVDDGGNTVAADQKRELKLCTGNSGDQVAFQQNPVQVSPPDNFVQSMVVVQKLAHGSQLKIIARSKNLKDGVTTITIRNAVHGVEIRDVPNEVTLGDPGRELSVVLVDKAGNSTRTDEARTITLTTTNGTLSPRGQVTIPASECQVTIPKGESVRRVLYTPSDSGSSALIIARSEGFADWRSEIPLVTALSWLVIFALFGGLIGGVARLLPTGEAVERVLPRWNADNFLLLACRIAGSVVAGLFLYLSIKLGFTYILGSSILTAGFDAGTILAAFFFGGLGGFAGTIVLELLVRGLLPGLRPKTAEAV